MDICQTPLHGKLLYIVNRVPKIQKLTTIDQWHHVYFREKTADIIFRRIYPCQLRESNLWWFGPEWLTKPSKTWLNSVYNQTIHENLPEHQKTNNVIYFDSIR